MKKLIFFFIMISGFVFGQNFISNNDIKLQNGKIELEKFIELRNGENNIVTVKLNLFGNESLKDFDFSKLDKIIKEVAETAKYNLKSPSTFIPVSIVLSRRSDNTWYSSVFYSGQNSYGGKKDSSSMILIDDEGNVIKNL